MRQINEIMNEIKKLVREAGDHGYKIESVNVYTWIDTSTCAQASSFPQEVNFSITDMN
jgi:hypothetical protein